MAESFRVEAIVFDLDGVLVDTVTELVVYEEFAANWHEAGRLRFGGDLA